MPRTEDGYIDGEGTNVWIPGEDFDPYDEDEMAVMKYICANERRALEEEY